MTPERWQQVKAIFLSALEREPQERALFLAQACSDDPQLKSEVEALISSHQQAGGSLETMVMDVAAQMLNGQQTAPTVAQKVGPYELVKKIGAGGMGEVYLARDNRLARQVALKLLPAHVGQDKQRLDRFKQEARTASALNHPNILTIYEIGEEAGRPFIATELIEGETLRERIAAARLPLNDALEVAVQVATGLSAAHEAGIVHRDIKPENLMLRHDGYVKILDFGLAKLINPHADGVEISTQVKTNEGVVMGTPRYMSPEQARGQKVDGRTDIFSLGTVLYEMLSGRAPFAGATPGDLIVAILEREEPPVSHYAEGIPAELDGVVRKALCKEREERYQTAKELLSDLKAIKHRLEFEAELERSGQPREENRSPVAVGARQAVRTADAEAQTTKRGEYAITESKRQKRNVLLIAGAVIVVAVAGYLVWRFQSRNEAALSPPRNAAFTQLTDQGGPEYFPSLAPDGKSFVYASYASGNWDIYFQRVGGKNAINLTKDAVADDTQPAFSPDGERITFRSERDGGGIFVMGATGESVKRLTDFGYNPAWSPDGKEIACAEENTVTNPVMRWSANNRVWTVSVSTGEKRLVMTEGTQPNWSPNGHRIALSGRLKPGGRRDIFTIPAGGGETIEVTTDPATDWNPVWSPDGKYLYFVSDRSGSMNLWRVPVEEHSGKVLGQPEAVTTPSPFSAHLSFSRDGKRVVYAQIVSRANFQQVGFDPRREKLMGQPAWITQSSRWANTPDLSPDGEWLAFDSQGGQPEDLFVVRRDGTSLRQLTDDAHRDRRPNWSPDGKQIVFFSNRSGKWEIWMINSDGSGLQQLTDTPKEVTNAVWSPDGTRLVYRNYGSSPSIIEVGKPWPEQSPEVLPSMKDLSDWFPWSWSPDGRKIAGFKMGAGGPEGISVFSLESRQLEKLTNFGLRPVWSSDSRRMLFQDLQARLYLLDSQSKKFREVLSGRPHDLGNGVALSRDDRLIYFSLVTTEADIWLMSLE
ncbi:MAG TPA: protein kinase [Blastocatellia bacterium]|nr:protein kinase [Blastocatellia bacterium]